MKKFFVLLMVALFGAMPLFADDADDVKAQIVKDCKLAAKGDFAAALALRTPDYQETTSDGMTVNYEQTKWMLLSLDGKHPEELLLCLVTVQNNGAMLPAETIQQLRQAARDPEFVKKYEENIPQLVDVVKAGAELELKTLTFESVKVDGDQAVAVIKYDKKDSKTDKITKKTETISLRKIDGEWKIYRVK